MLPNNIVKILLKSVKIGKKIQETLFCENFVFIDETWVKTTMPPTYGWAEYGKRVIEYIPHGH
jgi:hypothetical protein